MMEISIFQVLIFQELIWIICHYEALYFLILVGMEVYTVQICPEQSMY